ncbi:MAG TPA: flagellar biosynthetic protein FliO [Methylophilaceae bacterium]|nr:flagellar biosynthetic protein FliO [Methylophilaceae bacterium]
MLSMPMVGTAAETTTSSPGMSLFKLFLGLGVVLAVMALAAWGAKRILPGGGVQASAVKVVGGVSVGSRERVVVLEIAGRWIVVGVAAGQVSGIANLEPDESTPLTSHDQSSHTGLIQNSLDKTVQPFANWLKQSMNQTSEKK